MRITISGKLGDDAKPYQERKPVKELRSLEVTDSAKYIKIVEWSEEDGCFVGYCPGIIGPCCHGDDEVEVYRQLCKIVGEWLEIASRKNRALPPPTIGRHIAESLVASS